jgi:hypothetical protein
MLKDLHHLVDLKFNYLIAMDEEDEDIDIGINDLLLDFKTVCVDGILFSTSMKKGLLFTF